MEIFRYSHCRVFRIGPGGMSDWCISRSLRTSKGFSSNTRSCPEIFVELNTRRRESKSIVHVVQSSIVLVHSGEIFR